MHRTGQKNEKEKESMHEDSRLYFSFYNLAMYTYNNNVPAVNLMKKQSDSAADLKGELVLHGFIIVYQFNYYPS
jgi:hypothetical protein